MNDKLIINAANYLLDDVELKSLGFRPGLIVMVNSRTGMVVSVDEFPFGDREWVYVGARVMEPEPKVPSTELEELSAQLRKLGTEQEAMWGTLTSCYTGVINLVRARKRLEHRVDELRG